MTKQFAEVKERGRVMAKHNVVKLERIVEAVRRGLQGKHAVEFIHQSGFAIDEAAIARQIKSLVSRERIEDLIDDGLSNLDIIRHCLPRADLSALRSAQTSSAARSTIPFPSETAPLYDTQKLSLKVPSDIFEALRAKAHAERKTQNQVIVELLTAALGRPDSTPEDLDQDAQAG